MQITMDGIYETRDGRAARILCVDSGEPEYPVVAIIADTGVKTYTLGGKIYSKGKTESQSDLVEVSPWRDFKKDDLVMVCDNDYGGYNWVPRHFAEVKQGEPHCWIDGQTSWSGSGNTVSWQNCRKPTVDELKKRR